MRAGEDDFDEVMGAIYSSVFNPANWSSVGQHLSYLFEGVSGTVLFIDDANLNNSFGVSSGFDSNDFRFYLNNFYEIDPMQKFIKENRIVNSISSLEITPFNKMKKHRFYEFMRKYGFIDCMGGAFKCENNFYGFVSVERDRAFSTTEINRLNLLKSHVCKANSLSIKGFEIALSSSIREKLSNDCFAVVDSNCRLIHCGAGFEKYFESGYFEVTDGRLISNFDKDKFINYIRATAREDIYEAAPIRVLKISSISGKSVEVVAGRFNASHLSFGPFTPTWVVMLHIKKPKRSNGLDIKSIRLRYGLTPTEALVIAQIYETKTVYEIATNMHVSRDAVRFHLKNIFNKTGVSRQIELAKLAGSFMDFDSDDG